MHILNSSVTIDGNTSFNENSACKSGGALALHTANMEVREMHCTRNSALERGGAIGATRSTLNFTAWSTSLFCGNKASFDGGAISMVHWVNLVLSGSSVFLKNKAGYNGGGVCSSLASRVSVQHGAVTVLEQNSATEGGGIYSDGSEIRTGVMSLHFLGNSASKTGGGLSVMRTHEGTSNMLSISANFTTNKAEVCGGAVHVAAEMNIEFRNVTVVFNSGSAICV